MKIELDDDAKRRLTGPRNFPGNLDCDLFTYLCWAIYWINTTPAHSYDTLWKWVEGEINRNVKAGYW